MSKRLMRLWRRRITNVWHAGRLWHLVGAYRPFENSGGRCLVNETTGHAYAISPSGRFDEYAFDPEAWMRGQPSFLRWLTDN